MGLRLLLGLMWLLTAGVAQAGWLVAETAHFRIYSTMGETRLRREAAALEDYHKLLELLTGFKTPPETPRLNIYLVGNSRQLSVVRPDVGPQTAGFYIASPGGIVALAMEPDLEGDWSGGRDTLLHEYAHHFMMLGGSSAVPGWYREGFAEYAMTASFRPDRIEYGGANPGRYWQLTNSGWEPLEKVLRGARDMDTGKFYAQSWLLTHYLNRAEGMQAKRNAYLKKVAAGGDPVETFKTEIDPDLDKFQSGLRRYINSTSATLSRLKRAPPAPASVTITALPKSADAALLPLVAIQLPQKAEDDARSLARIREAAARAPADDGWAKRALAIGEAVSGDRAVAAQMLDALIMENGQDADLLRWRASLYRADRPGASAADVDAARKLLVRAWKAAPNDWQVLWAYANTFRSGNKLNDSVLDVLWKASELAPQVDALAMKTGVEMARAGHYDHAEALIAPVVNDPHGGGALMLERNLLAALRTRDKSSVDAALMGMSFGQTE